MVSTVWAEKLGGGLVGQIDLAVHDQFTVTVAAADQFCFG